MPSEINIAQHLHQWFQEYDELVIPELGRFEANYQNALIQPGVNKILPPNKEIFFDATVKSNDKKFAFYLANEENITLPEAEAQVHSFVQALKAELGMRKEYQAGIFGKFVYTPQGHIEFVQNEDTLYAGSSFGLPELYNFKPSQSDFKGGTSPDFSNQTFYDENLATQQTQNSYQNASTVATPEDDIVIEEEVVENTSRRLFMVLTLILLAVILGAVVYIISEQNPIAMLLSNKNNNNSSTEVVEDDPLEREDILDGNRSALDEEEDSNDNTAITDDTPSTTDNDTGPAIENPAIDYATDESFVNSFTTKGQTPSGINSYLIKRPDTRPRYYVILGSFSNQSNAYSYLNNLLIKGISSARIIIPNPSSNLHRIAYQDFATRQEAKEKGYAFCKENKLKFFILKY